MTNHKPRCSFEHYDCPHLTIDSKDLFITLLRWLLNGRVLGFRLTHHKKVQNSRTGVGKEQYELFLEQFTISFACVYIYIFSGYFHDELNTPKTSRFFSVNVFIYLLEKNSRFLVPSWLNAPKTGKPFSQWAYIPISNYNSKSQFFALREEQNHFCYHH